MVISPTAQQVFVSNALETCDPAAIQRALETAEALFLERFACECGASGCARSVERWSVAAAELAIAASVKL